MPVVVVVHIPLRRTRDLQDMKKTNDFFFLFKEVTLFITITHEASLFQGHGLETDFPSDVVLVQTKKTA